MLLWPEVQEYSDNDSRFAILHALEKSSFHAIFATLTEHLEFVVGLYEKEPVGTHRNAALGEELEMTRKLILKCGGSREVIAENRRKVEERKKNGPKRLAEPLFPFSAEI